MVKGLEFRGEGVGLRVEDHPNCHYFLGAKTSLDSGGLSLSFSVCLSLSLSHTHTLSPAVSGLCFQRSLGYALRVHSGGLWDML